MRLGQIIASTTCGILLSAALCATASAQCAAPPNTLTNGQATDATQVMGNFNHLTSCLNAGQLTVPPVSSLTVPAAGGGTYNLGLPTGTGSSGQFLSTDGTGQASWATVPTAVPSQLVDGVPVGRPAASALSWTNQGTATYTEYTHGPISLTVPGQSGDQLRALGQAPPGSTPYTLTVKLDTLFWGVNYTGAGIYIQDSTGKITALQAQGVNGNPALAMITRWNSNSSYNSTVKSLSINASRTLWFRARNDGTNWNFYISPNGADWIFFYSEALTTYLGPTISSLGVYGDVNASGMPAMNVSIWSFELATGSGTNSSW
jgi:hypothetical protein